VKTILHIGMPKTGSTALQETLLASHDELLRHGVLYPRIPDPSFNNHRLLLVGTMPLARLPRHIRRNYAEADLDARKTAFLRSVRAEQRAHAPHTMVLSSESLFRHFSDEGRAVLTGGLRRIGAEPAETTVLAYVRRPSDRYLSGLQQHLKASWKVTPPQPAQYRENLEQYAALFGAAAVQVVPFRREALIGADIVTDFLTRFLAVHGVERDRMAPVGAVNESLSAEGIDIQRAYRAAFHRDNDDRHTPDSLKLFAALQAIDAEIGMTRPRLVDGIADLVDYAATDPLWMRERFGVEFPGLDYARLERGDLAVVPERAWRLDELMQIDRDRQAQMAARLAAHRWTAADPARGPWLAGLRAALPGLSPLHPVAVPATGPATPTRPAPGHGDPITMTTPDTAPPGKEGKKARKQARTGRADKPAPDDAALAALVAKTLWKAEQKAANPAIAPQALKSGWQAARKPRIEAAQDLLKAMRKAGFRFVQDAPAAAEPPES
jgi:hypothetical protein